MCLYSGEEMVNGSFALFSKLTLIKMIYFCTSLANLLCITLLHEIQALHVRTKCCLYLYYTQKHISDHKKLISLHICSWVTSIHWHSSFVLVFWGHTHLCSKFTPSSVHWDNFQQAQGCRGWNLSQSIERQVPIHPTIATPPISLVFFMSSTA